MKWIKVDGGRDEIRKGGRVKRKKNLGMTIAKTRGQRRDDNQSR